MKAQTEVTKKERKNMNIWALIKFKNKQIKKKEFFKL